MRKAPPALLFFTDPERIADPEAVARTLPTGAGVVFRGFGAPDSEAQAARLMAIARRRGLVLLVGADAALARRIGAHGVHLPERMAAQAGSLKRARPRWLVTSAAHSVRAARASGADAVVVSVALPSNSRSAGRRALGPLRLALLLRRAGRPAYGLGGINGLTARRLLATGVIGLAAVEGFRT